MIVYFTRHGESVANLADRGMEREPADGDRLSERGWAQARGLGERLSGEGIQAILAEVDGHPVAAEQGDVLVVSFHPELTGETRLHARFLERVRARASG